jgi:hypothetical protein
MVVRLCAVALALISSATSAFAGPELVTNGNFSLATGQTTSCQVNYNCTVSGWSSPNGYNFDFLPNTATSIGATGQYGFLSLWGAANGGSNTWNGNGPTGLGGNNFIGADGAYGVQPITQMITGLIVGDHYSLTFDWAGAQQSGYTSATTEQWVVGLGGQSFATAVAANTAKGFTGWMTQQFTYTATSTNETLSFLAAGTPGGQPPFSLLTGVSLQDVPEPASLAVLVLGLSAVGVIRRRHRRGTEK